MAAGALRGEELNSILDGAPGIARAIEKYMGIAEGSIKSVAQEGKVTAEVVKNAMFAMADETNAKFDSMPKTWAQIWAGMKNQALSMFAPILTKINQIANSSKFQQVTTALINGLAGVANIASSVLDILISIASVVVDNWSWIQPIIMGIVAAMLIYNGVALATNIIMGIQTTAKAVHAAATAMEAGATFTATVAQQGLNAALLACPLTWIILLIIAVIAAIYAACAAVAKFTGVANLRRNHGGDRLLQKPWPVRGEYRLGYLECFGGLCFQHRNGLPQCHFQCSGLVLQPSFHSPYRCGRYL